MSADERPRPVWRSLLYVPANNPRFVEKAHTRGADAIILDLEDSCPLAERSAARERLAETVKNVGQAGADVVVRINREDEERKADIDAAVVSGVRALFVAKCDSPDYVRELDDQVSELEKARNLAEGTVGFSIMVESPGALRKAADIGMTSKRAISMSLGGEDFAIEMHFPPDPETLELPKLLCLMAAREAGLMPLGFLGTVADYSDLDAVRRVLSRSRKFGFEGASCIHPAMVPLLNEAFAPTSEEVAWAERVVTQYAEAQEKGLGAITVDGKMVDVPVAIRASRILDRHRAIAIKTSGG